MKTVEIGHGQHVPMLTVRDMMELADRAWTEERKTLLADLEESGATNDARLTALREHSLRRGTALILLMATMRLEFAADVIRRAAFAAKIDPDQVLAGITPAKIIETAQRLVGYEVKTEGDSGNA